MQKIQVHEQKKGLIEKTNHGMCVGKIEKKNYEELLNSLFFLPNSSTLFMAAPPQASTSLSMFLLIYVDWNYKLKEAGIESGQYNGHVVVCCTSINNVLNDTYAISKY